MAHPTIYSLSYLYVALVTIKLWLMLLICVSLCLFLWLKWLKLPPFITCDPLSLQSHHQHSRMRQLLLRSSLFGFTCQLQPTLCYDAANDFHFVPQDTSRKTCPGVELSGVSLRIWPNLTPPCNSWFTRSYSIPITYSSSDTHFISIGTTFMWPTSTNTQL